MIIPAFGHYLTPHLAKNHSGIWPKTARMAFHDTTHFLLSLHVFSKNALKSHKSFTYFTPDVFSQLCKVLIIKCFCKTVRVSFSAPDASQQCGAFLIVGGSWSMRLGQLAPVSSFRPGLHTATVYKQTTLYGRFFCTLLRNNPQKRAVLPSSVHESLLRSPIPCTHRQCTNPVLSRTYL